MNKREQLVALRTAQEKLKVLYDDLKAFDAQRLAVLNIIRYDIGPVVHNLQNEVEQEEMFAEEQEQEA